MPLCRCGCGTEVPAKVGPGRPRAYLPEHSPDKRVGRTRGPAPLPRPSVPASVSVPVVQQVTPIRPAAPEPAAVGALTASTLAQLTGVQREGTPEGVLALILAAQIDAGGGTQAGLATLGKAFREALAEAMRDAGTKADVIAGIFGSQTG